MFVVSKHMWLSRPEGELSIQLIMCFLSKHRGQLNDHVELPVHSCNAGARAGSTGCEARNTDVRPCTNEGLGAERLSREEVVGWGWLAEYSGLGVRHCLPFISCDVEARCLIFLGLAFLVVMLTALG